MDTLLHLLLMVLAVMIGRGAWDLLRFVVRRNRKGN